MVFFSRWMETNAAVEIWCRASFRVLPLSEITIYETAVARVRTFFVWRQWRKAYHYSLIFVLGDSSIIRAFFNLSKSTNTITAMVDKRKII